MKYTIYISTVINKYDSFDYFWKAPEWIQNRPVAGASTKITCSINREKNLDL